jgi:hypothetical protein
MAQDPVSAVASWIMPASVDADDKLSTVDPVVTMKAELDRMEAEAERLWQVGDSAGAELSNQAGKLWSQMKKVVPTSIAGLVAQLEILRNNDGEPDNLDVLIAGVRNVAASAAGAALQVPSWLTLASADVTDKPLPNHDATSIDTAPVRSGEEFGPCLLLAPGEANYSQLTAWLIGRWDGNAWADLEGPIVHPTHWAPLPDSAPVPAERRPYQPSPLPASAAADDPVLALIAEAKRLDALYDAAQGRGDEIFNTLPEDIQKGRVRVSFSDSWFWLSRHSGFTDEAHLDRWVDVYRRIARSGAKARGEDGDAAVGDFERAICLDQALAQLRAGLEEIKAAREASGCMAHYRDAEDLAEQAREVGNQISNTKPASLAGAIAMLELGLAAGCVEEDLTNAVIAGLRDMQPTASRIKPEPLLTAADREDLAEMLAEMGYDRATRTWVRNGAADRDQKAIGFGEPDERP